MFKLLLLVTALPTILATLWACGSENEYNHVRKKRLIGPPVTDDDFKQRFPWHVLIESVGSVGQPTPLCSGVLISDEWVLTAASCVAAFDNPSNYQVKLGCSRVAKCNRVSTVIKNVREIRHQDDYDPSRAVGYDLALVRLADRLDLSNNRQLIRPICIPMSTDHRPTEADECYTSSFVDNYSTDKVNHSIRITAKSHLIKLRMEVPSNDPNKTATCNDKYHGLVNKRTLCAVPKEVWPTNGVNKAGVCWRDVAMPLQCKRIFSGEPRWMLVGLSSWGNRLCFGEDSSKQFSLFTDLNYYIYGSWIEKVTRLKLSV